jgi:DNA invertase Pin-like site-specific DNA recombinase
MESLKLRTAKLSQEETMNDYIYPPPSSLPPGSTVIVYARDSGGPNQDDSIGQQERAIKEYCEKYGLVLMRFYAETASGRKTKNRKQFLAMFNEVMTAPSGLRPRGLLLWSLSRFARNVVQFNKHFFGLLDAGLIIHSLTEHIPEGLSGQMLLSFYAFGHAKYSEDLGKSIKRGISDKVKAGYCNGGQPPKGYLVVKDDIGQRRNGNPRSGVRWVPDPELAPLIQTAWELRAKGVGYAGITKATHGMVYTSKGSWLTHFRNKSYLGIGKAGDLEIPDHHEPLITWELWNAVKKVERTYNVQHHYKQDRFPSLLAGLAYCIYCGAAMILHTSPNYRGYACGKRDRQRGYLDCTMARRVNARKAERLILDAVLNRILSPDFVNDWIVDIQSQLADTDALDQEIGKANKLLITTERSITRQLQLVEETGEIAEIAKRLIELKQNKAELEVQIKKLKFQRDTEIPQLTPEVIYLVFAEIRSQIQNAVQGGEILIAKKTIKQFVQKIELSNKTAIIHYVYPLEVSAVSFVEASAH